MKDANAAAAELRALAAAVYCNRSHARLLAGSPALATLDAARAALLQPAELKPLVRGLAAAVAAHEVRLATEFAWRGYVMITTGTATASPSEAATAIASGAVGAASLLGNAFLVDARPLLERANLLAPVARPAAPAAAARAAQRAAWLPADVLFTAWGFLEAPALGATMRACRRWYHLGAKDAVWRPVAVRALQGRLCLLPDVVHRVRCATATTMFCRDAVRRAVLDATRVDISLDEIASLRFHMRLRNFAALRALNNGVDGPELPADAPPVFCRFKPDMTAVFEGPEPGSVHPAFPFRGRWEFRTPRPSVEFHPGATPPFRLPPSHLDRERFTCFGWQGRPALRVWRHPTNWHVCLTHINCQYASFVMPPVGSDTALDNDQPYLHPELFQLRPDLVGPAPPAAAAAAAS